MSIAPSFHPARTTSPSKWLTEGLVGFTNNHLLIVNSVIPTGFPTYARIIHPNSRWLSRPECTALLNILQNTTCHFAIWTGYNHQLPKSSKFKIPRGDEYSLYTGDITGVLAFHNAIQQPPNIWWPEDKAWCIASDIDSHDTFIGASDSHIKAIAATLETEPINLTDRFSPLDTIRR